MTQYIKQGSIFYKVEELPNKTKFVTQVATSSLGDIKMQYEIVEASHNYPQFVEADVITEEAFYATIKDSLVTCGINLKQLDK